jgi:hypothetical protein
VGFLTAVSKSASRFSMLGINAGTVVVFFMRVVYH